MLSYENRSTLPAATILAVALALGLAAGGWLVGKGLAFLKKQGFAEAQIERQPKRTLAEQFAADSGARVGDIRSANRGTIQIFGTDGNDESAPFSPASTPVKKIRVVSTFEFAPK